MSEQAVGEASGSGLRRNFLSFPEVLGQSVANVAPTLTPTANIPLVFASAGTGTWAAYLLALIGMLLVGANISQFARRSAAPGSLYGYVERGLGPVVGVMAGWALAGAYLLTGAATLCGFGDYANVLLAAFHVHVSPLLTFTVCALAAGLLAYRDVRLSAVLMLLLEFLSVTLILALAAIVLIQQGGHVDWPQLRLEGVSAQGIRLGLVLGVFSFVGFESATALGHEARNPLRAIPRSVVWSTAISGLFFIFMSYVEVAGFRGLDPALDKSDAPLNALANAAQVPYYGLLISIAALVSFFACALACINAGARIIFSLARHGVLHPVLGQTHPSHFTPAVSVVMTTLLAWGMTAALSLIGVRPQDAYGYFGTLATFGFLVVYALISLSAPICLAREKSLRWTDAALGSLSVLFMVMVCWGSVYPVPAPPMNVLPYLFLIGMAVGGVWYWMLHAHSPKTVQRLRHAVSAENQPEAP